MARILIAVLLQKDSIKRWYTIQYDVTTKKTSLLLPFNTRSLPRVYTKISKQDIEDLKRTVDNMFKGNILFMRFNEAVCKECGFPNPAYETEWEDNMCLDCASL